MAIALEFAQRFASLDTPVLIEGETGTGKELVARALHALSARAAKPLVVVDCGSLPETLVESELFGHERGSFTGADRPYAGRIQSANEGTIFLDEVNSVSLPVQAKLLRFLERSEFCRMGQSRPVAVNVRLIAASNVPLETLVSMGRIRSDFYYRLNVLRIELPPLRDRPDDLPLLVDAFLKADRIARQLNVQAVSPEVMAELRAHHWPGNVRELFNLLHRAIALGTSDGVLARLPRRVAPARPLVESDEPRGSTQLSFRTWMRKREHEYLLDLVRRHRSVAEQAIASGLPQRTLYRKLRSHGIRSAGVGESGPMLARA